MKTKESNMKKEFNNLLIDFYEFTMGQAYFDNNKHNEIAYFDLFFRRVPDKGSFVIANGVKKCIEYLQQFSFSPEDINYLRSLNKFSEEYLQHLSEIKFTGDVWAVEDGTVVFANEPVITVRARLLEAQLIETSLLMFFNRASLITTKASRIVRAAQGRGVLEFGTRRAQGQSAAVDGALDTYIAGAIGTGCTQACFEFGLPIVGTMAHSFVQGFDSEYESFVAYVNSFPNSNTLLVDTYNTLESGVPNAIKVYNEVLKPKGKTLHAIRIDSGDLAYLAKEARKLLDQNGLTNTKIVASNSLDEHLITSLLQQGAPIDVFGVGENMITAKSQPVFGGVYKLVAMEKDGKVVPKIKVSDNIEKITNPHFKNIIRLYDKQGKLISDVLTEHDEQLPSGAIKLSHPNQAWTYKEVSDYTAVDIRVHMIKSGKLDYNFPTIEQTRQRVKDELDTLWPEALRLENPHLYVVNLSDKLTALKEKLLNDAKNA